MMPEVVPGPPETVSLAVAAPLQHRCPFVDEVDEGFVTIRWSTCGNTIELHSLRRYLQTFQARRISHEALTDLIKHDIDGLQGIFATSVSTTWTTAGMDVTCSTSPIPAGQP